MGVAVTLIGMVKSQKLNEIIVKDAERKHERAGRVERSATLLVSAMGTHGVIDYSDPEKWLALCDNVNHIGAENRVLFTEEKLWEMRRRSREMKT